MSALLLRALFELPSGDHGDSVDGNLNSNRSKSGRGSRVEEPEATKLVQEIKEAAEEIESVLRAQRQQQASAAAASPPPPPPPVPSSPSPIIPIGTRVLLFGLKGKPELNGQPGVVTDFVAASGRLKVNLEDGRGPFSLLPKNLHEELD